MDTKLQYNVYMRKGNSYEAITLLPMSEATAHALAMMLSQERYIPYTDDRFCVSIGKPKSFGFEDTAVSVGGCIIDKLADTIIREMVTDEVSIEMAGGQERWHLLQQAGLVTGSGFVTRAAKEYVTKYPQPIK